MPDTYQPDAPRLPSPQSPPSCADGLVQLCRDDPGVDRLIAPRREAILALLNQYIAEIELVNPALGLVGTNDRQALIVRHVLDSLAPLAVFLRCAQGQLLCADVGSGAGLPGIPLAIAMPHVEFTLIERMSRRVHFLRNVCAALGLANVAVEEAEMEKAQPGRFGLVTFRAFKPLEPKIFKKLFRLCSGGAANGAATGAATGAIAAYKGRREKIEAEVAALETVFQRGGFEWQILPCPVPFLDEQRHILYIHKPQNSI